MKYLTIIGTATLFLFSCSSSNESSSKKALVAYQNFVDSIYAQNTVWKQSTDSTYVETPYDPNDPNLVRIDTIITPPEAKTTLLMDEFWGASLMKTHESLKSGVEMMLPKMDEAMKKEYETSRLKFESMMAK